MFPQSEFLAPDFLINFKRQTFMGCWLHCVCIYTTYIGIIYEIDGEWGGCSIYIHNMNVPKDSSKLRWLHALSKLKYFCLVQQKVDTCGTENFKPICLFKRFSGKSAVRSCHACTHPIYDCIYIVSVLKLHTHTQ